jgi:hypothetical protein
MLGAASLVGLLGGFAAGPSLADPVRFGDRTVEIPVPQTGQYRALAAVYPQIMTALQSFLPAQVRLVDTYVSNEQYADLALGANKPLNRYFQLQVSRPLEGVPISEAQFGEAQPTILQGIAEVANSGMAPLHDQMAHGNQAVQAQTGHDPGIALSDTGYLGSFRRAAWAVFYSVKTSVKVAGSETPVPIVMSGSMIDVDGQLLMLNAYSRFSGPQDLQWTQQAVSAWADAVHAANAVGKHAS